MSEDSQIMQTIAMIKEIYKSIREGMRNRSNMKELRNTLKKSIEELKGLQKNGGININIDNSKTLNQTINNNQQILNMNLEKTLERQQNEFKRIAEPKKIDQLINKTKEKVNEQQKERAKAREQSKTRPKTQDPTKAKPRLRPKSPPK